MENNEKKFICYTCGEKFNNPQLSFYREIVVDVCPKCGSMNISERKNKNARI